MPRSRLSSSSRRSGPLSSSASARPFEAAGQLPHDTYRDPEGEGAERRVRARKGHRSDAADDSRGAKRKGGRVPGCGDVPTVQDSEGMRRHVSGTQRVAPWPKSVTLVHAPEVDSRMAWRRSPGEGRIRAAARDARRAGSSRTRPRPVSRRVCLPARPRRARRSARVARGDGRDGGAPPGTRPAAARPGDARGATGEDQQPPVWRDGQLPRRARVFRAGHRRREAGPDAVPVRGVGGGRGDLDRRGRRDPSHRQRAAHQSCRPGRAAHGPSAPLTRRVARPGQEPIARSASARRGEGIW